MSRQEDWERRLERWMSRMAGVRWEPGAMDCALFVASAVEAMTGEDHAAPWRGYATVGEGQAALQAAGHADHVALVATILPEVAPRRARPGDVGVLADGALCIVQGRALIGMGETGMVSRPRSDMIRAFEV